MSTATPTIGLDKYDSIDTAQIADLLDPYVAKDERLVFGSPSFGTYDVEVVRARRSLVQLRVVWPDRNNSFDQDLTVTLYAGGIAGNVDLELVSVERVGRNTYELEYEVID